MNILKNKFYLFGGIAIILLFVAAYFLLAKSPSTNPNFSSQTEEVNVERLSAEDIGLSLSLSSDKRRAIMTISKLEGIEAITYELNYDAEVADKESGAPLIVSRGLGPSTINIEPGQKELTRNNLDLGTCSANVCKYDKVVSDIEFIIKVTYSNGRVGVVNETLPY